MSSKNRLYARFVTDAAVTSTGFIATVKALPTICGNHRLRLKDKEKLVLVAPDDGHGHYLPNLNCYWRIRSDNIIHLQFEKLDLQAADDNGTCSRDALKIYNTDDIENIERGFGEDIIYNAKPGQADTNTLGVPHVFCGNRTPDDFFSRTKEVFVKFQTDSTMQRSGFKINISPVVGCFRNFTGTQGRILIAETEDHCDIYITAPQNYSLSLYANEVMFSDSDCNVEYVEVFEAKTNTSLRKDCQYVSEGSSVFSTSNALRLRIKLSGIYTMFDYTYLASQNGPGCGGELYTATGMFTSPFYPNHVRENSDCRWNIRVPSNLRVLLFFREFNLGAKSTCHSDYLQIIEHKKDGSEVVVRQFCGEDTPGEYKSENSFVSVRFHKTLNYDGTGWVIQFSGVYANHKIWSD